MTRHLRSVPPVLEPVAILWSAPDFCCVCGGSRLVAFSWPGGRVRGRGVMACPQCPSDPNRAVRVVSNLPWRRDEPRKEGVA